MRASIIINARSNWSDYSETFPFVAENPKTNSEDRPYCRFWLKQSFEFLGNVGVPGIKTIKKSVALKFRYRQMLGGVFRVGPWRRMWMGHGPNEMYRRTLADPTGVRFEIVVVGAGALFRVLGP